MTEKQTERRDPKKNAKAQLNFGKRKVVWRQISLRTNIQNYKTTTKTTQQTNKQTNQ